VHVTRATPDKPAARTASRHSVRAIKALDARRNRGELWESSGRPSAAVHRTGGDRAGGAAGQSPTARRVQATANCSEFASCGAAQTNRASSEHGAASNASRRSASDSYMKKVILNKLRGLEKSLVPAQGCMNGTDCWMP
jgi:hypothetical protein